MSSGSNHLPGLYLYVNYSGKKVNQHFTKFDDDSARAFRNDLIELKFNLPKTVNMWLFVRGCVVGFWPDVSEGRQAILYNNLRNKIHAATEDRSELEDLSIHAITLKELDETGWTLLATTRNKSDSDSPRPAKRRRYLESSRSPSPPHEQWATPPRWKRDRDEESPRDQSPLPMWAKTSRNQDPFPKMETLRSNLLRVRARVPALLDQGKALSDELMKLGAGDIPPPMKLADAALETAKEIQIELLQKQVKSMEAVARLQASLKARLEEAADNLAQEQHLRLQSETTAAQARQGEADLRRRLEEVQDLLEREIRGRTHAEELVATTQRSAAALQDAYDSATQEKEDLVRRYERAQGKISVLHREADVLQEDLARTARELGQAHQELREEKERRKALYQRLAGSERGEAALKVRCEEAAQQMAAVARARTAEGQNARVARQRDEEALRVSAEKARTQQLVIREAETAMREAQSSEESLKRRLEEVERSLEVEKRMRREAEDAIEDIRRECREPFVVPSLLDAFVELARLTTVATVANGVSVVKREGDEMACSNTPLPTGPVHGSASWPPRNHIPEHLSYTPPAPDVRMESATQHVKVEQPSPTWR